MCVRVCVCACVRACVRDLLPLEFVTGLPGDQSASAARFS